MADKKKEEIDKKHNPSSWCPATIDVALAQGPQVTGEQSLESSALSQSHKAYRRAHYSVPA